MLHLVRIEDSPSTQHFIYHIRPNYCTVRLGFSKLLGKLVVKFVLTYTNVVLLLMLMRCFCTCVCVFFFLLHFLIKAYVVGIHLNCIDKTMEWLDCALIVVGAVSSSNTVVKDGNRKLGQDSEFMQNITKWADMHPFFLG